MARLQEQYKNEIIPKLKEELGVSNALSVPKIEKITINMGLGSALGDKKVLEIALEELGLISSQKPITCLARKSVASFKLREGNAIGCKVTLRKERMYEFLDRLVNVAIYNSTTQKSDRVGVRVNDKGVKERFFKSNGETVV